MLDFLPCQRSRWGRGRWGAWCSWSSTSWLSPTVRIHQPSYFNYKKLNTYEIWMQPSAAVTKRCVSAVPQPVLPFFLCKLNFQLRNKCIMFYCKNLLKMWLTAEKLSLFFCSVWLLGWLEGCYIAINQHLMFSMQSTSVPSGLTPLNKSHVCLWVYDLKQERRVCKTYCSCKMNMLRLKKVCMECNNTLIFFFFF